MATVANLIGGTEIGATPGGRSVCLKVTMDSSYPTGGEILSFSPYSAFYGAVSAHPSTVADRSYSWDNILQKLVAIVTSTGAQVANTTDLSADVVTLTGFLV